MADIKVLKIIGTTADWFEIPRLLAFALTHIESGWDPYAVGDAGHSVGLCQLHDQGMGSGLGMLRYIPSVNCGVSFHSLANTPHEGLSLGQWAAKSQRPFDPVEYARLIDKDRIPRLTDGDLAQEIAELDDSQQETINGFITAVSYMGDDLGDKLADAIRFLKPSQRGELNARIKEVVSELRRVRVQFVGERPT